MGMGGPLEVTLSAVTDWTALGERWQDLEACADASFFQGWSWIGCLAPERYDDPLLLEARYGGRTLALGLFNRRRTWLLDTLWLHETGHTKLDGVFIEYNGLLLDAMAEVGAEGGASTPTPAGTEAGGSLRAICLGVARRAALPRARLGRRLVLSGVDAAHLCAAGAIGRVSRPTTRIAPTLDLATLRGSGLGHENVLSANARAQLRRSMRAYAAIGTLAIRRAADTTEAHRFLDALASLHQATWQHRGREGAFAEPHFARFHHTLIDRALPRGEVELWRVTAGSAVIGYLYNFQYRGRVLAYQSGFDYAVSDRRAKPGLTCHYLAIERAMIEKRACYDFMAGDDRYKRSFSNATSTLYWLTASSSLDPIRLSDWARGMARTAGLARVINWLLRR
jgi:CelD/BcsL family acetyltransferase involved in cellulose biosynthesis